MKLFISDYKKILKFYKLSVPKKSINIKKKADKIIAKKFCSCIKKVQQKFKEEGIAIGICTNSVITKKGYKRGKFKCKKRRTINLHKGGKRRKKKTRRKRKKKTRKKRGGMESNTPRTSEMKPKNSHQHIPHIFLPPNLSVLSATTFDETPEEAYLHNLSVSIIGLGLEEDPNIILQILKHYQTDYNGRIASNDFQPSGNFKQLLNNDVQALQNYIIHLQSQSGGCFPNCKNIKEKCVGCLKPARVEPLPLGVVMDNQGNIIQHGRATDGRVVSEEDGPYEIWILNRRIERLNREGKQLEKQIEEAESPFRRTGLQKIFDKKKKEWLEANRKLLVEENKIAATTVAYPAEPVAMRR
jgi:hypothetical protein